MNLVNELRPEQFPPAPFALMVLLGIVILMKIIWDRFQ